MTLQRSRIQQGLGGLLLPKQVHWWLFLVYLAVLPVAGTIALRNVVLAILTAQSLFFCIATCKADGYSVGTERTPAWFLPWAIFLVFSPLIAQDSPVAWRELGGQWLESLLAWFVAFVVVRRVRPTESGFLSVGLASALYPFLYLVLFLWAWMGGFGYPAYIEDIPQSELLALLARNLGNLTWPSLANLPWGFRGFDPIHANLGAAAAHAFVAFAVWGLARWQKGLETKVTWLVLLLGWTFLTPVLASSRASVLCISLLVFLAVIIAGSQIWRKRASADKKATASRFASIVVAALAVLCVLSFLAYKSYEKDSRWRTLYQKATIGFWIPDALDVVCNGVSRELESSIRSRLTGMPSDQVDEVVSGMGGDGGRALVMRAGLVLVLERPLGLDGSRNAYKRLISERCGKVPAINFVHPHQGWIDLALALGWAGVLLYLGMFLSLMGLALTDLSKKEWTGWGVGLLMLCVFWIMRGLFDSMYREHYLQMQGALIGFFWRGLLQKDGHVASRSLRYEGVKNE